MSAASRIDREAPQPFEVVHQLFKKLAADYGERSVLAAYDTSDPQGLLLVQEEWRHKLQGIDVRAIDWALEHLGERHADWPPNVLQFVNLCREWRPPLDLDGDAPALNAPKTRADFPRIARELARLEPLRRQMLPHRLSWAERIVGRHRRGENVAPTTLAMARRALGQLDGETSQLSTIGNFKGINPEHLPEGMREKPSDPSDGPGPERFGR
jgi:hypothetical protein